MFCFVCQCAAALAIPVLYYLDYEFMLLSYCFPKLREQSLVHLKSHVVLHAELTGYLLSTKLLYCLIA